MTKGVGISGSEVERAMTFHQGLGHFPGHFMLGADQKSLLRSHLLVHLSRAIRVLETDSGPSPTNPVAARGGAFVDLSVGLLVPVDDRRLRLWLVVRGHRFTTAAPSPLQLHPSPDPVPC